MLCVLKYCFCLQFFYLFLDCGFISSFQTCSKNDIKPHVYRMRKYEYDFDRVIQPGWGSSNFSMLENLSWLAGHQRVWSVGISTVCCSLRTWLRGECWSTTASCMVVPDLSVAVTEVQIKSRNQAPTSSSHGFLCIMLLIYVSKPIMFTFIPYPYSCSLISLNIVYIFNGFICSLETLHELWLCPLQACLHPAWRFCDIPWTCWCERGRFTQLQRATSLSLPRPTSSLLPS